MRIAILMILILLTNWSFAQSDDFNSILGKYDGKRHEIDTTLAKRFFGVEFNEYYNTAFTDRVIFQKPYLIGLTLYLPCGAGGICESTILGTFDFNGNLIDKLWGFESEFADCSFDNRRYCSYESDSLLIIIDQETTGDCEKDTTFFTNKIDLEFIRIDKDGRFKKGKTVSIDTRRDYYSLSTDLTTDKDLNNKTKDELSAMRNEIFAAHGYKFKTDKWRKYFKQKQWYTPCFDNVNALLSLIEKENIQMILKYEKK